MARIPFVGPSYQLESREAGVQRTINMVPVPQEPGNERTKWTFKDVPGLELFAGAVLSGSSAATSGTDTAPTIPSETEVGDGLLLFVTHRSDANLTLDNPSAWTAISAALNSSGGLYLRTFGRVADGTANDDPGFSLTVGKTECAWIVTTTNNVSDGHFPSAMSGGTDFNGNLEATGINPGGVTKATSTTHVAFAVAYFQESTGGGGATITALPTGYAQMALLNWSFVLNGTTFVCQTCVARRAYTGAAENPSYFADGTGQYAGGGVGALTIALAYAP